MKARTLIHNARIYTQADNIVADSMAICKNRIVGVGRNLKYDSDFKNYSMLDLKGRTIVPGFVDAHTHFYHYALSFRQVSLYDLDTVESCLKAIQKQSRTLSRGGWVVGEGFSVDRFRRRADLDRLMLDRVTAGHPAFFFSKDQHTAWANSRALEIAGIGRSTKAPAGGEIDRLPDGSPSGLLRETAAYEMFMRIPVPTRREVDKCYRLALEDAYRKGMTGVHSFDRAGSAFEYYSDLASKDKLGLRINYYFPAGSLPLLKRNRIKYGMGTEFFRVAGIKMLSDGSLGSQSALCFKKYIGSHDNYGIETMPVGQMIRTLKSAAGLGLPAAIHAIGDRAVSNVLDALESAPLPGLGVRHRIEHLQLIRRRDIPRLRRLGLVVSMQPSHCPSDIPLMREYWGARGKNAFIFRTLLDRKIPLAFGSDVPIEPLDPIAGIAAAVRRARPKSKDVFYPVERISAREALYGFTAGPAFAVGQENCRGLLLDGYPADFAVLSDDICKVPPTRITDVGVLATVLDGKVKFCDPSLRL